MPIRAIFECFLLTLFFYKRIEKILYVILFLILLVSYVTDRENIDLKSLLPTAFAL